MISSNILKLVFAVALLCAAYTLFYLRVNHEQELTANMTVFWAEMKWNLLTSLIDFVVVVLGVGFLISFLDERKWLPARQLVAQNGANAAAWCVHAGHHCFATEGVSLEHQNLQMRQIFLQKFQNQILRFEESIHLCNAGLGKDLMPAATEAIWNMKKIIPVYAYLLSTLTPETNGQGHIFAVPESLLRHISEYGDKMVKEFGLNREPWLVTDPKRSVSSMKDFVQRNKLIYLEGTIPEEVDFKLLNLYDADMLRALSGAKNIEAVRLFSDV
ncbi:hypothetical protein [Pseudomonas syringae]|uniref:hypothetical protein n=1 Tax=Pseudomonas syringae TaxID=317 RepID=UPI00046AB6BA|nr:hypothetical protein [Pseudomonas syringae]